jgi:2-polyprenyl-3-methyl-5-hydroxy-6-metoxy-1,4-benzoquinol methylase
MPSGGNYAYEKRKFGYNIICDYIGTEKKVFDYACGLSVIGSMLKENGNQITGCDFSDVAIDYCKKNIDESFYVGKEIIGNYDFIISTYFIEHIIDPVWFINDCLDHAKEVICSIPNNFHRHGEHIHMQWGNWEEFNELFSCFDLKRIDNYPVSFEDAYKHPTFVFKRKKC